MRGLLAKPEHEQQLGLIRAHSTPLEPVPTGARPVLAKLPDIHAVLFDVYGTLFVSASGELGSLDHHVVEDAFAAALDKAGLTVVPGESAGASAGASEGAQLLQTTIRETHDRLRAARVEFPEVDIVNVWKSTVQVLRERELVGLPSGPIDWPALALEFELRSNPVWPMPGAQRCLTDLAARGVAMGVVSNGQWFSPLLFPALLGGCLETLGVPADLQLWSYQAGEAKPGLTLYRQAKAALDARGIAPEQVLFVGNDMLFDIAPAAAMGFHTALFAGDARSLRLREGDGRVAGVVPDLVVLNLLDIVRCVRPGGAGE